VVTLALFFLSLTTQVQRFGLNKAFIHRDEDSPANLTTFASLRVGLTAVAVVVTLIAAPILGRLYPEQPALAPVLIALALFETVRAFNGVAETVLVRELQFRRLAALDVASSLTMTVVAPAVALAGGGIWALVAEQITGGLVRAAGLWLYRRPWRPAFGLDRELTKWYFRFGSFVFANSNLSLLLDQFDDFWTGTFLGPTALGFYSRAYEFARYPRRVLSGPIVEVFFPIFARLRNDRLHLSRAFYRVCSLIVRVGFLVFGTFVLVVPEFIRIFLGERWLPMAVTFQLMLAYTLLDPLVSVCGNLLSALGHPGTNTRIQLVRAAVFIPAVITLGRLYGINGVAVAVDLMLLVGISLFFRQARHHVDFSLRRMFLVPILGLALGGAVVLRLTALVSFPHDWAALITKGVVAALVYLAVSFALERGEYTQNVQLVWNHVRTQSTS